MISPLAELRTFLTSWSGDLTRRRLWLDVLDSQAAQEITTEAITAQQAHADLAYRARCADDEALALIERCTADHHLSDDDLPAIVAATRHIRRSREADHRLAEHLSHA